MYRLVLELSESEFERLKQAATPYSLQDYVLAVLKAVLDRRGIAPVPKKVRARA